MIVPVSRTDATPSRRDQRLDEAVAEYLLAAEAGRAPDRREFLARYPDLAGDLASFFDDEDCVRRMAGAMSLTTRRAPRAATPAASSGGADPDPELRVGGQIGDFELLEEIAVGGMGVVFKARQKSLNRVVALKTIRPGALRPGDDAARRFRIEAEAVARLDHPGIVPIYEMGEHRGSPFLCLKLIEGGDLERHIARLRSEPAATARLMADVARAVHYAHQRGILHRDLKPSNILIDRRGRPHVTDFGLSRSARGRQPDDPDRADPGHAVVHGARAGLRPARRGDHGGRRLRPGRRALHAAGRPAAVPGRHGVRDAPPGPRAGAGAPRRRGRRASTATSRRSA